MNFTFLMKPATVACNFDVEIDVLQRTQFGQMYLVRHHF